MARAHRGRARSRRFSRYLRERLAAFPQLTGRRLHRELRDLGYTGGYSILTDFLRDIRPIEPAPFEVRFETPPGRQAQVDFAHFRTVFADEPGTERILWLFSLVLGHSRMLWARFVPHQDLPTLLRSQAAVFEALGGVPEHILYDRMRTVFSREDPQAGHIVYNRTLLEFCPSLRLPAEGVQAVPGQDEGQGRAAVSLHPRGLLPRPQLPQSR